MFGHIGSLVFTAQTFGKKTEKLTVKQLSIKGKNKRKREEDLLIYFSNHHFQVWLFSQLAFPHVPGK